jgi:hypothetical protein
MKIDLFAIHWYVKEYQNDNGNNPDSITLNPEDYFTLQIELMSLSCDIQTMQVNGIPIIIDKEQQKGTIVFTPHSRKIHMVF